MVVNWPTPANDGFVDGTWLVGTDIQPGLYRAVPPTDEAFFTGCYWERLSGLSGDFGDLLANNIVEAPTYVRILDSDTAFASRGCGQWSKVEE